MAGALAAAAAPAATPLRERMRTVWLVAVFDFFESIRSRKALGLLALALLGSISSTSVFSKVIYEAEKQLARTLNVAHTEKVGVMADEVFKSDEFQLALADFVGDAGLAKDMSRVPPIAFFSGWLGLLFLPLLVILSSSDAASQEISTGSARFALFRSDRLSWALGKLAGQAMLMASGIFVGALGTLAVAAVVWHQWHPLLTMAWMARLAVRVWIYGFAWLGVALGISLSTRSVNLSRGAGLVALFGLGFLARVIHHYESSAPVLLGSLEQLFPHAHSIGLWRPALVDRLPSVAMLLSLGVGWFAAGYARFARRDK
ncbi:MAG TPA: hypothetical protein VMV18_09950 [bacterium]|nr:hypothetical protein [bacterium]